MNDKLGFYKTSIRFKISVKFQKIGGKKLETEYLQKVVSSRSALVLKYGLIIIVL